MIPWKKEKDCDWKYFLNQSEGKDWMSSPFQIACDVEEYEENVWTKREWIENEIMGVEKSAKVNENAV